MNPLRELADYLGIEREWRAHDGSERAVSDETLVELARLLGADISVPDDAPEAIAALRADRDARLVDPVVVAWDGSAAPLVRRGQPERTTAVVEYEGGDTDEWRFENGNAVVLPRELPFGAHRLTVMCDGSQADATVLSAPARLPRSDARRGWGVFAPLYALHSGDRAKTGDLVDLERLGAWAADRGAAVVGTLPLLATFVGHGAEPLAPSPYQPVSRRFWNEAFLPVEGVRDPSPGEFVDVAALASARRPHLEAASERARTDARLARFRETRPDVAAYARFRAATEGGGEQAVRFHEYVQWRMEEELTQFAARLDARGQMLYLDMPVGTHRDGYDADSQPDLFLRAASVGAPPDEFQPDGQDWGLPPVDPRAARRDGHRYLRACVEAHVRQARLLRIDHVMGLHRLWVIPPGAPPSAGAYVRYPADEQWAAVCLEASRRGASVVGENLGTVPAETDRALEAHDALGMWVAQFHAPERPHAGMLASVNTHDLPPFVTWWHELDPERRGAVLEALRGAGQLDTTYGEVLDPGDVHDALLQWMGASDADIVLVTLEDLWLEARAQNQPGSDSHQNFSRRFAYGLGDLETGADLDAARRTLDRLNDARRTAHLEDHVPS